jgi:hypothetical protein
VRFRILVLMRITRNADPGRVFDFETDLDGIAEAYAAMDERRVIKSLVRMGTKEARR